MNSFKLQLPSHLSISYQRTLQKRPIILEKIKYYLLPIGTRKPSVRGDDLVLSLAFIKFLKKPNVSPRSFIYHLLRFNVHPMPQLRDWFAPFPHPTSHEKTQKVSLLKHVHLIVRLLDVSSSSISWSLRYPILKTDLHKRKLRKASFRGWVCKKVVFGFCKSKI